MNAFLPAMIRRLFSSLQAWLAVGLSALTILAVPAVAEIRFEEVSQAANINRLSQTAGSGWGDLNGDGWPDLWVTNHDWHFPSIYLNLKNGTFAEVADTVLPSLVIADFHGPGWADFDNDGDQDLVVISGGAAGRGFSPNSIFVQEDGRLKNAARELGLDYPMGRGRTPLWFDADGDGKLDLAVMNQNRIGGKSPSAIFLQTTNGFVAGNRKLGFNPRKRSRREKINDLFGNLIHFRFRKGAGEIIAADAFAQLADLTGDGIVELVAYTRPMRVYSTQTIPFKEITNEIGFPSIRGVQDVAIADVDGNGRLDMFLARAFWTTDVVQISPLEIAGSISGSSTTQPKEIRFRSSGQVTFTMHQPWRDPSDPQGNPPPVWAGSLHPIPADGRSFTLSSDDTAIQQSVPLTGRSVSIDYDLAAQEWIIRITHPSINFTARSAQPIDRIQTAGFEPSKGVLADILLLNSKNGFKVASGNGLSLPTTCWSVVTGDFDNDMDIDLYLVCGDPTQNSPNLLYENDGRGNFSAVANAGGAAGSHLGRGNQVTTADYDRDGFLDLFVTNGKGNPPFSIGPHQLFRNQGNGNHWLEIDLQGMTSNRGGIGAVVAVEAGGGRQVRVQDNGTHSFSQNHQRIHVGLGTNTQVDALTIRWPSGIVQELTNIAANQILTVVETAGKQQSNSTQTALTLRHAGGLNGSDKELGK
jgi:hypothetical protein